LLAFTKYLQIEDEVEIVGVVRHGEKVDFLLLLIGICA